MPRRERVGLARSSKEFEGEIHEPSRLIHDASRRVDVDYNTANCGPYRLKEATPEDNSSSDISSDSVSEKRTRIVGISLIWRHANGDI